jgi:hypothetical protein
MYIPLTHSHTADIPSKILDCEAVAREIVFSSRELMDDFRLEQRILWQVGRGDTCVMEEHISSVGMSLFVGVGEREGVENCVLSLNTAFRL